MTSSAPDARPVPVDFADSTAPHLRVLYVPGSKNRLERSGYVKLQ